MQLRELADTIFTGRKSLKPTSEGAELPMLRLPDLGGDILPAVDALQRMEASEKTDPPRSRLQGGDVVVTSRTARFRAAVVPESYRGVLVGPNLVVIRLNEALLPEVLVGYLRHPDVQQKLLSEFASQTPPGFSVRGIGELELDLPSIEEQQYLKQIIAAADEYNAAVKEAAETRLTIASAITLERLLPK